MTDGLRKQLGLPGAMVTGLGSIIGTGAFVAIGVASGEWGDAILWAIPLAAVVAVFNGLSSAFLAGRYPYAGGTYFYGRETLGPWIGYTAGWLFLLAKTASAATAALGVSLYLGLDDGRALGVLAVVGVTILVIAGLRQTTAINTALLLFSVSALAVFAVGGTAEGWATGWTGIGDGPGGIIPAIAFLFVAYTGYGRIATLGEEVHDPAETIPRAVVATLAVAALLYFGVALGGRGVAGAFWGDAITSGITLGDLLGGRLGAFVSVGAVAAMLGVLLNLVLGLSRVWLAMGRTGDMPPALARLDARSNPKIATIVTGVAVSAAVLIGDIKIAWSFSAMTVLLYYGITNVAALRLEPRKWTAWAGMGSCVFLSFFVSLEIWLVGIGLIALGLVWKTLYSRGR